MEEAASDGSPSNLVLVLGNYGPASIHVCAALEQAGLTTFSIATAGHAVDDDREHNGDAYQAHEQHGCQSDIQGDAHHARLNIGANNRNQGERRARPLGFTGCRRLVCLSSASAFGCGPGLSSLAPAAWSVRYRDLQTGLEEEIVSKYVIVVAPEVSSAGRSSGACGGLHVLQSLPASAKACVPPVAPACRLVPAAAATAPELIAASEITVVGGGAAAESTACAAALLRDGASVRLMHVSTAPEANGATSVQKVVEGAALLSYARRRALAASLQPHYAAPQPGLLAKALRAPAKRRFWALVKDKLALGRGGGGGTGVGSGSSGEHLLLWAPNLHEPRFMPFLSAPLREALLSGAGGDGDLTLYRGMVHPDVPGLAFVGLEAHAGSSLLLLELQAQWLAAHLAGQLALPAASAMRTDMAAQRAWRSGSLAHPLMSAGGSLARRQEQCYLEQLRRDLQGASAASTLAPMLGPRLRPADVGRPSTNVWPMTNGDGQAGGQDVSGGRGPCSTSGPAATTAQNGSEFTRPPVTITTGSRSAANSPPDSAAVDGRSSAGPTATAGLSGQQQGLFGRLGARLKEALGSASDVQVALGPSEPLPRLPVGAGATSTAGRGEVANAGAGARAAARALTTSALDDIEEAELGVPAAVAAAAASASGIAKASPVAGSSGRALRSIHTGPQHRSNADVVGGGRAGRSGGGSAGLSAGQLLLTSPASPRALLHGGSDLRSHSSAKSVNGGVSVYDNSLYGSGCEPTGTADAQEGTPQAAVAAAAPDAVVQAPPVPCNAGPAAELWASSAAPLYTCAPAPWSPRSPPRTAASLGAAAAGRAAALAASASVSPRVAPWVAGTTSNSGARPASPLRRPPRRSISMPNAQAVHAAAAQQHVYHPSPLSPAGGHGSGPESAGAMRVSTASLGGTILPAGLLVGSPRRQGLGALSMSIGRSPLARTDRGRAATNAGGGNDDRAASAGAGAAGVWRPESASNAVDALQSQMEALRNHLRNPAQVPFPSPAGAGVGIAEGAAAVAAVLAPAPAQAPAPATPTRHAPAAAAGFIASMLSFSRAPSGNSAAASPRAATGGVGPGAGAGGAMVPAPPGAGLATQLAAASARPLGVQSTSRLRLTAPDLPVLGEVNEGREHPSTMAEATAAGKAAQGLRRRLPPRRSQTSYDLSAGHADAALARITALGTGTSVEGGIGGPDSPRLIVERLKESFRPRTMSSGGAAFAVASVVGGAAAAPAAGLNHVGAAPAVPSPVQSARGSFIHTFLRRRPPQRTASVGPTESWRTAPPLAGSLLPQLQPQLLLGASGSGAASSAMSAAAARAAIAQAMAATQAMTGSRRIAGPESEAGLPVSPVARGAGAASAGSQRVKRSMTASSFLGAGFSTGGTQLRSPASAAASPTVTATVGADAASDKAAAAAPFPSLFTPCADLVLSPRAAPSGSEHRPSQRKGVPQPPLQVRVSNSGTNLAAPGHSAALAFGGAGGVSGSHATSALLVSATGGAMCQASPRSGAASTGIGAGGGAAPSSHTEGGTFDLLVGGGWGSSAAVTSAVTCIAPGMRFSANGSNAHGSPVLPGGGSAGPSRMGMGPGLGLGSVNGLAGGGAAAAGGSSRKSLIKLGFSLASLLTGGGSDGNAAARDSFKSMGGLLEEASEAAAMPYSRRMAAVSSNGAGSGAFGASPESSLRAGTAYFNSPRSVMLAPSSNGAPGGGAWAAAANGKGSRPGSDAAFRKGSTGDAGGSSGGIPIASTGTASVLAATAAPPGHPASKQLNGVTLSSAAGAAIASRSARVPYKQSSSDRRATDLVQAGDTAVDAGAPVGNTTGSGPGPCAAGLWFGSAVGGGGSGSRTAEEAAGTDDDGEAALLMSLERVTAGQGRQATAPCVPQPAVIGGSPTATMIAPSNITAAPLPIPISAAPSPPVSTASSHPASVAQEASAPAFGSAVATSLRMPPTAIAADVAPGANAIGAAAGAPGIGGASSPASGAASANRARPKESEPLSPFAEGAGPAIDEDDFDAALLLPVKDSAAAGFAKFAQMSKPLGAHLSMPLSRPGGGTKDISAALGSADAERTRVPGNMSTVGQAPAQPQRWSFAGSASLAPAGSGSIRPLLQSLTLVPADPASPIAQQWVARHTPWLLMARSSRTNQPLDPHHQQHGEGQHTYAQPAPVGVHGRPGPNSQQPAASGGAAHGQVPCSASEPLPAPLLLSGHRQAAQQQPAVGYNTSGIVIEDGAGDGALSSGKRTGEAVIPDSGVTVGSEHLSPFGTTEPAQVLRAPTAATGGALHGGGSADVLGRREAGSGLGFGHASAAPVDLRAPTDYPGAKQHQRNPPRRSITLDPMVAVAAMPNGRAKLPSRLSSPNLALQLSPQLQQRLALGGVLGATGVVGGGGGTSYGCIGSSAAGPGAAFSSQYGMYQQNPVVSPVGFSAIGGTAGSGAHTGTGMMQLHASGSVASASSKGLSGRLPTGTGLVSGALGGLEATGPNSHGPYGHGGHSHSQGLSQLQIQMAASLQSPMINVDEELLAAARWSSTRRTAMSAATHAGYSAGGAGSPVVRTAGGDGGGGAATAPHGLFGGVMAAGTSGGGTGGGRGPSGATSPGLANYPSGGHGGAAGDSGSGGSALSGTGMGVGAGVGGADERRGPAWAVRRASQARQEQLVSEVSARLREALKARLATGGGSGSGSMAGVGVHQLSPLQNLSPRECSISNGASALSAVHEVD